MSSGRRFFLLSRSHSDLFSLWRDLTCNLSFFSGCFQNCLRLFGFSAICLWCAYAWFSSYLSCSGFSELLILVNICISPSLENLGPLFLQVLFSILSFSLEFQLNIYYTQLTDIIHNSLRLCPFLFCFQSFFSQTFRLGNFYLFSVFPDIFLLSSLIIC